MLPRMLLVVILLGWLAAACVTAALFAVLARAGRTDEPTHYPEVSLPQQRSRTSDVRRLESQR